MRGMAHSLEERRLKLLPAFGRALEFLDVRKQDLLFFLHMRVHFLPQPPEFLFDGSEFRVTLPMSAFTLARSAVTRGTALRTYLWCFSTMCLVKSASGARAQLACCGSTCWRFS